MYSMYRVTEWGLQEFEAALVSVEEVAEAGVVGFPHPIKGQGVYAHRTSTRGCG